MPAVPTIVLSIVLSIESVTEALKGSLTGTGGQNATNGHELSGPQETFQQLFFPGLPLLELC